MNMNEIINHIRIKDRDKFERQAKDAYNQLRTWLQEHGEWALFVGIIAGIFFVLFFKLIIVLLVIGGLAGYLVWEISSPKAEDVSNTHNTQEHSTQNDDSNVT